MSWSIGFDTTWHRDIGYGVPAYCDHPGCGTEIDRGLSYVCGGAPYGGDKGCGLYFCEEHLLFGDSEAIPQVCRRCLEEKDPFEPTPDHLNWIKHKLTDESWERWRQDNQAEVEKLRNETNKKARA